MEHLTRKTTIVYIIMLGIAVAGMWCILGIGNRFLKAKEDLAGKWEVKDESAPASFHKMSVMQSGRFFRITFESGPVIDLVLEDETVAAPAGKIKMKLVGDGWTAHVSGDKGSDDLMFAFFKDDEHSMAEPVSFEFHRTEHGYGSPNAVTPPPSTQATTHARI